MARPDHILEGRWKQLKGEAKRMWGKLTGRRSGIARKGTRTSWSALSRSATAGRRTDASSEFDTLGRLRERRHAQPEPDQEELILGSAGFTGRPEAALVTRLVACRHEDPPARLRQRRGRPGRRGDRRSRSPTAAGSPTCAPGSTATTPG